MGSAAPGIYKTHVSVTPAYVAGYKFAGRYVAEYKFAGHFVAGHFVVRIFWGDFLSRDI